MDGRSALLMLIGFGALISFVYLYYIWVGNLKTLIKIILTIVIVVLNFSGFGFIFVILAPFAIFFYKRKLGADVGINKVPIFSFAGAVLGCLSAYVFFSGPLGLKPKFIPFYTIYISDTGPTILIYTAIGCAVGVAVGMLLNKKTENLQK